MFLLIILDVACEQALWSGKEQRKQRVRKSKETGRWWGRKEGGEREGGATLSSSPVYAWLALLTD